MRQIYKLQINFTEITLRHECCPVNFLHIFKAPFPNSTCGGSSQMMVSLIMKLAHSIFFFFLLDKQLYFLLKMQNVQFS